MINRSAAALAVGATFALAGAAIAQPPAPLSTGAQVAARPTPGTLPTSVPAHPPALPAKAFERKAWGADYAESRYAPLDQINADTLKYLHIAWRQSLTPDAVRAAVPAAGPAPINNQTTPIMVGGLVYYSTGVGGVAALDAETGRVVWHVDRALPGSGAASPPADGGRVDGEGAPLGGATRSVAYFADGKDGRIIALVGGRWLTALNAKTGARIADFGAGGQVDLRAGQ